MAANTSELTVYSPYDGKPIDSIRYSEPKEIESWMAQAYKLSRNPRLRLPQHERIAILRRAYQFISDKFDRIVLTLALEGGKPLTDAKSEIERALVGVTTAIETLSSLHGTEVPMDAQISSQGRWAFTRREPVGTVLAFSAFNHPFNLAIHQVIPAVALGCPLIIKPSSQTPLSCRRLIEILYDAGLPEEWCRILICSHSFAEALVRDSRLAHFSFVGSSELGWKLRSSLAPGVHCSLEHGGLAPVIMNEDADFSNALPLLLKGGFYHAGQVCVSVQRVFVHESQAKKFTEDLARGTEALRVGNPIDPATEVGPLIRSREVRRIDDWVNEAIQTGAELITGGKVLGNNCYSPTILFNPPEATRISRHEVFGPVIAVYSFKQLDEAIARANQPPYLFQSSIFTENIQVALKCCRELEATAVMVNDHPAFRVDWMPFGGRRHAGMGVGGIPYSTRELTYEKLCVWKSQQLI